MFGLDTPLETMNTIIGSYLGIFTVDLRLTVVVFSRLGRQTGLVCIT